MCIYCFTLNHSEEHLLDHCHCTSTFPQQPSLYCLLYGQIHKKGCAADTQAPPFPPISSLTAQEDLVLPAGFGDLIPPGRELQPLRAEHEDEVNRFLCAFFDLSRFKAIREMLWLIAVHGAPRSLYYQKFLRREIVITEELDLHLVWPKSRIFVKPLPDFLLNYEFWETHISCEPQLHQAACELLYSYCGLIRFDHDLQVVKDCNLVNADLDYRAWSSLPVRYYQISIPML
jgi:hypothetical protein